MGGGGCGLVISKMELKIPLADLDCPDLEDVVMKDSCIFMHRAAKDDR